MQSAGTGRKATLNGTMFIVGFYYSLPAIKRRRERAINYIQLFLNSLA